MNPDDWDRTPPRGPPVRLPRFQICQYIPDPFRGDQYAIGARVRLHGGEVVFLSWDESGVPAHYRQIAAAYRDALGRDPMHAPGPCFGAGPWTDLPIGLDDPLEWVASIGNRGG